MYYFGGALWRHLTSECKFKIGSASNSACCVHATDDTIVINNYVCTYINTWEVSILPGPKASTFNQIYSYIFNSPNDSIFNSPDDSIHLTAFIIHHQFLASEEATRICHNKVMLSKCHLWLVILGTLTYVCMWSSRKNISLSWIIFANWVIPCIYFHKKAFLIFSRKLLLQLKIYIYDSSFRNAKRLSK